MDEWPIGSKSDDLKDALAEVAHDWRKGDPQGMLERVTGLFGSSAASKRLVVVSDFQQSDWQTAWRDFRKRVSNWNGYGSEEEMQRSDARETVRLSRHGCACRT